MIKTIKKGLLKKGMLIAYHHLLRMGLMAQNIKQNFKVLI